MQRPTGLVDLERRIKVFFDVSIEESLGLRLWHPLCYYE